MTWIVKYAFEIGVVASLLLIAGFLCLLAIIVAIPYIRSYLEKNSKQRKELEESERNAKEQKEHDDLLSDVLAPTDPVADRVKKKLQKRRAQEQKHKKEETQTITPPLKTSPETPKTKASTLDSVLDEFDPPGSEEGGGRR